VSLGLFLDPVALDLGSMGHMWLVLAAGTLAVRLLGKNVVYRCPVLVWVVSVVTSCVCLGML
jgi:hypothetical protein